MADGTRGRLVEVFSSIQGEGPLVGARQVFIRFELCNLHCRYCDTPDSLQRQRSFGVRYVPFSNQVDEVLENPATLDDLLRILDRIDPRGSGHHSISLTGGEPLLQAAFLSKFLPIARDSGRRRFYLETDAVLHQLLSGVLPHVDIVSADVKIPSASGEPARYDDHRRFLDLCAGKVVFAKLVVCQATTEAELREAIRSSIPSRAIPIVIQPVSPMGGVQPPEAKRLADMVRVASEHAEDVRCLPQIHRLWRLP